MRSDVSAGGRLISWIDVAPALFLFVLPIAHTTPLRIVCLVLSLVTAIVARRRNRSARLPPPGLMVTIGYWICICLASSWTSIEPGYSWGEFRNEVLSTIAAFVVFYALTDDERAWRRWCAVLFASFLVIASIAVVSYGLGMDWGRAGLVGDRNAYSTYVVLIVPFLFLLWLRGVDRGPLWRGGIALAIVLALVSGAFTQNRNMWFAVGVEAIVFAALVWFRLSATERLGVRRRYVAASLIGLVVFGGALAFVIQQKAAISKTTTEEQARFDRDPRLEIWVYAAGRIGERPWFGRGYGRGILRSDFRTHFDNPLKWHGHNMVIDYALEAGVFGAIAIIALLLALTIHAARLYRTGDVALWPIGAWTLAMLVGVVIKTTTDDILVRDSSLLFWSVLGMNFGLASRLLRKGSSAP